MTSLEATNQDLSTQWLDSSWSRHDSGVSHRQQSFTLRQRRPSANPPVGGRTGH